MEARLTRPPPPLVAVPPAPAPPGGPAQGFCSAPHQVDARQRPGRFHAAPALLLLLLLLHALFIVKVHPGVPTLRPGGVTPGQARVAGLPWEAQG